MLLLISLRYTACAVILQVWIYLLMYKINKILALDILNVIYVEFMENTYGVVWWYLNQFETYSGSPVFQHDQQWEGTHKFCWAFYVRPDYEAVPEPGKERVWWVSPPCRIQRRAARASCTYSAHLGHSLCVLNVSGRAACQESLLHRSTLRVPHGPTGVHTVSTLSRHCGAGDSSQHPPSAALYYGGCQPLGHQLQTCTTSSRLRDEHGRSPASLPPLWACGAARCGLFDASPWHRTEAGVIRGVKGDRTKWSVRLLVCSSRVGMAPRALEIPADFQKAGHRQTCLGHDGSAQHRVEKKEPAIITAIRYSLYSVEEYKSIWNKACYQVGDTRNWTTSKRNCTLGQKNHFGSYVYTRVFNKEMYFCVVIHYWCQKWMPEEVKQFLLLFDNFELVSLLKKTEQIHQHLYIHVLY